MENILENSIIGALHQYLKKEDLKQTEMAQTLGWSPQDLSDTLRGRKPLGKNRQSHIKDRLGKKYEKLLVKEVVGNLKKELVGYEGIMEAAFGDSISLQAVEPFEGNDDHLSGHEREYVGKLISIFRKKDKGTISAITQSIDTFIRMPDDPEHKVNK